MPLKAPGDDASETSQVSGDEDPYGIAAELGADARKRRQRRKVRTSCLCGEGVR